MADGYDIAILRFYHRRFFLYNTRCHNCHLRLIDNRCTHDIAKTAYIGQRKCAAGCIIGP